MQNLVGPGLLSLLNFITFCSLKWVWLANEILLEFNVSRVSEGLSVSLLTHGAETKWPPLFIWHYEMYFLNENVWISINISLKFVPKAPIHNIQVLIYIMAWHRLGDKPLSEPMVVRLLAHICVFRLQLVHMSHVWFITLASCVLDHHIFHILFSSYHSCDKLSHHIYYELSEVIGLLYISLSSAGYTQRLIIFDYFDIWFMIIVCHFLFQFLYSFLTL